MQTNKTSREEHAVCPRCGQTGPMARSGNLLTAKDARCAECGELTTPMSRIASGLERRAFLGALTLGAAAYTTRGVFAGGETKGAFAEELTRTPLTRTPLTRTPLTRTPWQTEGPFYPDKLPLDTDNDLLIISKNITPAVGAVTHLSGRVLDARGGPVPNAVVEIWQVDNNGSYLHSRDFNGERDANFQGYGRFETGKAGEYRFRTIKPVPYPGRTPHIHMKVSKANRELLTTQVYVKGHPQNERDGVLRGIRDPKQRASVIVPFAPMPKSRIGELAAKFDIVLGWTPAT